jgi:hypothetical protein
MSQVAVGGALWLVLAVALAGCGFDVQAADLFLMTRTGQGTKLTMLVNDAGTISCDRKAPKPLPDPLLLRARDLASSLDNDAKARLHLRPSANSVYQYSIELPDGTISFPDTAGLEHPELAQAESFAVQAAQQSCGIS